jgi:FAD/FMN-containing dehydrogenase
VETIDRVAPTAGVEWRDDFDVVQDMALTRALPDWSALERAIEGDVVLPGSPEYDSVRKPAIARFHDVRPQAVVRCRTPEDVSETLAFVRGSDLRVAPRSGGHCFAGRSSTEGVVIDVTPMSSVSVADGLAAVGAGARLGDLYDSLAEHELTIPAGCGPEVGIAGLTLGGGLGILGRGHGLTCDQLVAAQVVLADGRVVDCDEHHDEDLFWALRGAGGGNFGVVTSFVFRTLEMPIATRFRLAWPYARAADVIDAWQAWSPSAPDEVAASLLVSAAADGDEPPAVTVFGAMIGTEADTANLLDQLVANVGVEPASAQREQMPYRETKRYLAEAGASEGPVEEVPEGHPYSKSEFFRRPLPADAIAELVDHFGRDRVPGQSRELDFSPWGGAYNRVPADATAFVHRSERFLLKHAVVVDPDASPADREAARRWLAHSWELVHPWGSGGVYPNFPDPDLADPAAAYYGTNYDRLVRVKASYDPSGVFELA